MDILEPKQKKEFDNALKVIIKQLQFFKNPIELKGSSSLKSQNYFSDYDFFCAVPYKPTLRFINTIRTKLNALPYVYPIEVKIETKDGKKLRYYKKDPITSFPRNVKLIKVDLVVNVNLIFTEVSCIYLFTEDKLTSEEYITELENEIETLKSEGKFYKVLKRLFSIYRIKEDDAKLEIGRAHV